MRFLNESLDENSERLMVTFLIAAALHVFVISTVGFKLPEPKQTINSSMEVILVQKSTEKSPKDADFLAQASHDGGGQSQELERPATPTIAPFPDQTAHLTTALPVPKQAAATQKPDISELTTDKTAHTKVLKKVEEVEIKANNTANETEEVPPMPQMPASTLIANSLNSVASIQAELDEKFNDFSQQKRIKHLSGNSAKEFKYALYMEEWRRKIEEVGKLNFPEEVRKNKLAGKLILDVALNANGTIYEVSIKKSSGSEILDQAALRIVRLAAPFAPFSEEIHKETDVLHITRTWEFLHNSVSTKGR